MIMEHRPEMIMDGPEFAGSRSTIPDALRAQVVQEVESGVGRNEVARRTGLGPATVSRIAAAAGLGFADLAEGLAVANRARLIQLQQRRLVQSEQLHLTLDAALALAQAQMIMEPTNVRGISERSRAVRDLAAAYRDLVTIDAGDLAKAAILAEAESFLDGVTVTIRGTVGGTSAPEEVSES